MEDVRNDLRRLQSDVSDLKIAIAAQSPKELAKQDLEDSIANVRQDIHQLQSEMSALSVTVAQSPNERPMPELEDSIATLTGDYHQLQSDVSRLTAVVATPSPKELPVEELEARILQEVQSMLSEALSAHREEVKETHYALSGCISAHNDQLNDLSGQSAAMDSLRQDQAALFTRIHAVEDEQTALGSLSRELESALSAWDAKIQTVEESLMEQRNGSADVRKSIDELDGLFRSEIRRACLECHGLQANALQDASEHLDAKLQHSIDELRRDFRSMHTAQREEARPNDAIEQESAERLEAMDRQIAAVGATQESVRSLVMRDVAERLSLFEASLREFTTDGGRASSPSASYRVNASRSQNESSPVRQEMFDMEMKRIWRAIDGSWSQTQAFGTNGTSPPQPPSDPLLGSATRSTIQLVHALAHTSSFDQPVQRPTGVPSVPATRSRSISSHVGQPVSLHSPTVPNPFRVTVQPPTIMVSCSSPSVPPQRIAWSPDYGGSLVSCPGRQGA